MIDNNGEIVWGGIQPQAKYALYLLRNWTENGIIDSRMLTMSANDIVNTYVITQRSGIFFSTWEAPQVVWNQRGAASQNRNEDMQWVPNIAPLNSRGQFSPINEQVCMSGRVVMNSHLHPEAVIKAMNLIDEVTLLRNPDFDDLWQKYFAPLRNLNAIEARNPFNILIRPQSNLDITNAIRDYISADELYLITDDGTEAWWALDSEDRIYYLTITDDEDVNIYNIYPWWYRFVGYWTNTLGNMIIDKKEEGIFVYTMPGFVGVTPSWYDYYEELMELQISTFIDIMSGILPLEAFDDFVEQWLEEGGQTLTNEVNELMRNR
jgi:putative aldouronate transport system substrate-binding protein